MTYQRIRVHSDGPIGRIIMAWPEKRNALSLQMMEELTDAFRTIDANREARAVILQAEGKVFSAGHYLPEMIDKDINHQRHVFDTCVTMMSVLQSIRAPVIAAVPGVATAAGCQLVAACDLAVAADTARFATPGVKIGLFCTTPMVALTRAIGRKRALQMLLTGEFIDAITAADWGLVNSVVAENELISATEALAKKVADASPLVIALGKQAFYTQIELDQGKAYDYAKEVMSMNAMAADAQEGMSAFLEKREPTWVGK